MEGTINQLALHDFAIFQDLFRLDIAAFESFYGTDSGCRFICDYENIKNGSKRFNERIKNRLCTLSVQLAATDTPEEFMEHMVAFYKDFGVGKLGLHKAFRLEHRRSDDQVEIVPINRIAHVHLDDLVGYDLAKKKLTDNTEAFLAGKPANNCLLYGDAGTGKSTCIKAILNQYYDQGLRIIEVY